MITINKDLLTLKKDEIKENNRYLAFCLVIIIFCLALMFTRSFWLYCVRVSGSSMYKTVKTGDYLLVDKINQAKRGDVIVFTGNFTGEEKSYIKRLIAIGGDTVKINEGKVWIKKAGESEFTRLQEDYVNGGITNIVDYPSNKNEELIIPKGYVYALGDNRRISCDCRTFGPIKVECVDGVVSQFIIDNRNSFFGKLYKYL